MDQLTGKSGPSARSFAESTSELPDAELVSRVRAGDETAFEEIFNRHRRRVALIGGRFFQQREQIEEIIQEAFTKAFLALDSFSGQNEGSFASWLARIAFNTCYDELRRQRRKPEVAQAQLSEERIEWLRDNLRSQASDIASQTEVRDIANKLLSRLSPEDQLVLVLLDAEDMSVAQIASLMNWSSAKVKVRAYRARASLRRVVKKFL